MTDYFDKIDRKRILKHLDTALSHIEKAEGELAIVWNAYTKYNKEQYAAYICLLYTSPSPRDS